MNKIARFLKKYGILGISANRCECFKTFGIDYLSVIDSNAISCIDANEDVIEGIDYDDLFLCIKGYFKDCQLYNVVYYNEYDLLTSDILFIPKGCELADAFYDYGISAKSIISYQSLPTPKE
jgi:hypothetical protein